ncbi:hypothetical protein CEUSTIGMA_g9195.t1 [Chlamydomonas eustigma]|uniref:Uncharacterized protein n=1 Tax=Chlamydomonas eustigma TaxID=1157962 RepID=A0A250XFB3_9CHLO|nr:hypothetical protein CEUSTIGMA_g9195.t1 [Chlamydomonas eustigma]|eukprot:GAX81767.1 hypothetical protein CEUSTIGMA_g9195.t1 [Chlamydomonas eustigma]
MDCLKACFDNDCASINESRQQDQRSSSTKTSTKESNCRVSQQVAAKSSVTGVMLRKENKGCDSAEIVPELRAVSLLSLQEAVHVVIKSTSIHQISSTEVSPFATAAGHQEEQHLHLTRIGVEEPSSVVHAPDDSNSTVAVVVEEELLPSTAQGCSALYSLDGDDVLKGAEGRVTSAPCQAVTLTGDHSPEPLTLSVSAASPSQLHQSCSQGGGRAACRCRSKLEPLLVGNRSAPSPLRSPTSLTSGIMYPVSPSSHVETMSNTLTHQLSQPCSTSSLRCISRSLASNATNARTTGESRSSMECPSSARSRMEWRNSKEMRQRRVATLASMVALPPPPDLPHQFPPSQGPFSSPCHSLAFNGRVSS